MSGHMPSGVYPADRPPRMVIPDDARINPAKYETESDAGTVKSGGACWVMPIPKPTA